eukprot:gene6007-5294_t
MALVSEGKAAAHTESHRVAPIAVVSGGKAATHTDSSHRVAPIAVASEIKAADRNLLWHFSSLGKKPPPHAPYGQTSPHSSPPSSPRISSSPSLPSIPPKSPALPPSPPPGNPPRSPFPPQSPRSPSYTTWSNSNSNSKSRGYAQSIIDDPVLDVTGDTGGMISALTANRLGYAQSSNDDPVLDVTGDTGGTISALTANRLGRSDRCVWEHSGNQYGENMALGGGNPENMPPDSLPWFYNEVSPDLVLLVLLVSRNYAARLPPLVL